MNNITKLFEGTEVKIIYNENDEILFELYSTGIALGYVKYKKYKDKTYKEIRKDRIDKVIENAEISTFPHAGGKYLTESQLYDFMLEARTDKCRAFRKWVTDDVLPNLINNRCYILEDATEEQVTFESLYGKDRLRKTFTETTDVNTEYDRFKKLSKEKRDKNHHSYSNQCRIDDSKTIIKILEDRARERVLTASPSEIMVYQELITKIQADITLLTNQRQGGIKAQITRKLNKLRTEYDSVVFELNTVKNEYQQVLDQNEELRLQDIGANIPFTVIEKHGFSNNKMYKPRGNQMKRTADYNAYENSFPKYKLRNPSFIGHLDFTKPICCELKFAHIEAYDVHNFIKPTLDIISRAINCDDKIIRKVMCSTDSYVDDYKDGRIYIKLYNI